MDWKNFFESYRTGPIHTDADLLYQVGATVGGKAISERQFAARLDDCRQSLDLRSTDKLLDLCAGNGVMTFELAKGIRAAIGVDFSTRHIETARAYKSRQNLLYMVHDATDLQACYALKEWMPVSRVLCYEALAYLTPVQVDRVVEFVAAHGSSDVRFFVGSILDKSRIWNFFDTWPRRLKYLVERKIFHREFGLGRWWTREELLEIAGRHGFVCEFKSQNSLLHTAHYRIDMLLRRGDPGMV